MHRDENKVKEIKANDSFSYQQVNSVIIQSRDDNNVILVPINVRSIIGIFLTIKCYSTWMW